ncbi:MAG TPA: hypothetical protein DEW46_04335, partial [Verrucomicrobia bacterium]|nr:hypothetical protein [Verrucomicrobiota bacterium]
ELIEGIEVRRNLSRQAPIIPAFGDLVPSGACRFGLTDNAGPGQTEKLIFGAVISLDWQDIRSYLPSDMDSRGP